MLSGVAVRRAEEIKHLTEGCGFVLRQIKSIQLKAEGRKEKHAQQCQKKPLCFQWPGKLFKDNAFL